MYFVVLVNYLVSIEFHPSHESSWISLAKEIAPFKNFGLLLFFGPILNLCKN